MGRFFVSHPFLFSRILIILPQIRRETKANCFSILYPSLFRHLQIDAGDRKSRVLCAATGEESRMVVHPKFRSQVRAFGYNITDQSQEDQILNGNVYVQNTEHFLRSNLFYFTCSFEYIPSNICYMRVKKYLKYLITHKNKI